MFEEAERRAFEYDGFVHLPEVLVADDAAGMRERVWRQLERNGAARNDPTTARGGRSW